MSNHSSFPGDKTAMQALDLKMKKAPTQPRARATVEAVVTAAAQLLAESGYASLTTNHIAERAGVSIGSLYQYFPGKEAIVARVIEDVVGEILREFAAGLLSGEPVDHLRAATVLYETIDHRAALLRAIQYEVPFARDLPVIEVMRLQLHELSSRIYAANVGERAFSRPNTAAFLLTAMLQAAVMESILAPLPGIGRAEVIETLAEIIGRIIPAPRRR